MTMKKDNDRIFSRFPFAAAALACAILAGCSSEGNSQGRFLVAPGKFVLYTCPELALRAKQNAEREQKLRDLMTKAEAGAGGHLVSTLAYKPEYDTLQEESRQLQEMMVEKKCKPRPAQRRPGGAVR